MLPRTLLATQKLLAMIVSALGTSMNTSTNLPFFQKLRSGLWRKDSLITVHYRPTGAGDGTSATSYYVDIRTLTRWSFDVNLKVEGGLVARFCPVAMVPPSSFVSRLKLEAMGWRMSAPKRLRYSSDGSTQRGCVS